MNERHLAVSAPSEAVRNYVLRAGELEQRYSSALCSHRHYPQTHGPRAAARYSLRAHNASRSISFPIASCRSEEASRGSFFVMVIRPSGLSFRNRSRSLRIMPPSQRVITRPADYKPNAESEAIDARKIML